MRLALTLIGLAVLLAQPPAQAQSAARTDESSGSSVRIERISPSLAQPIRAGQKVKFEVEIAYVVNADSATVGLIIQRGDSADNPVLSFTTDIALKGSGRLKMSAEALIPDTRVVHVFTPLSHQGDTRTSVVDMRSYKVAPRE